MKLLPGPKMAPLAIVLGALVLTLIILSTRPTPTPQEASPPSPAGVPAMRVETSANNPLVKTQGRVRVRHQIDLVAQVGGIVESVTPLFNQGAQFSAGDLLLTIEKQDYQNALQQAQAELANARQGLAQERAQAEQARREWRDLGSEEANALFLREPQLEAARARLQAAESSLQQAQINLQRTEVTAPFDGEIESVVAGLGQYVTPGSRLAGLHSTSELEISLSVTSDQLDSLDWANYIGRPLSTRLEARIFWTDPSGPHEAVADVRNIGGIINENTQLYPVHLNLSATNNERLPSAGQFVEVELLGDAREQTIWLPRTAIYERSKVLLVTEGNLQARDIEILAQTPDEVLVAGLQDEQIVVLQRPLWVLPGQPVTPLFNGRE